MGKKKTRYTMRSDGIIVASKTYDGKRKYFYGHSDPEIDQKIADFERQREEESKHHSRLFEEIADEWWEWKQKEISPNTYNGYKVAKERAVEQFGQMHADEITPADVYKYLDHFAKQGYSQKTINNMAIVLKVILDEPLKLGEIAANPCVNVPRVKGKPKVKRKPAADSDIEKIEAHKADSMLSRMYYLMLYTGLRRGEAIALQYKNIDFNNNLIHVVQSCAYTPENKVLIKSPKTEAGIRTVVMLNRVKEIIPRSDNPEAFVFFPDGIPTKGSFENSLQNFKKEAGIQSTPHQLRHSFATIGHAAGIDAKDLQAELGHSTLEMTMNTYTHEDPELQKKVRKKLDKHINAQEKKKAKSCAPRCSKPRIT